MIGDFFRVIESGDIVFDQIRLERGIAFGLVITSPRRMIYRAHFAAARELLYATDLSVHSLLQIAA
ncbi:hypothetical protein D3C81_1766820 [compost metagenome]